MKKIHPSLSTKIISLALAAALFMLSGCQPLNSSEATASTGHDAGATSTTVEFEPYYLTDFRDLLIPGELLWNREKSVTLNSDSFNGGILNFSGRVEVTSLMEFYTNSMKNDGWASVGAIRSKNVLLAFTKENSSCMIKIIEGGPLGKTEVDIYIANSN
ncbi:MAG: hypothetical protein KAS94_10050 [Desulfobulbaceae bacterium]|nr:hypothetical protein [Desulfobulbaceae bacterium]